MYLETISAFTEPETNRFSSSAPCAIWEMETHQRSSALLIFLFFGISSMDGQRARAADANPARNRDQVGKIISSAGN